MIGHISPGCVFAFWHRRQRLSDEIAAARRRVRARPDDLDAHAELVSLLASEEALTEEAAGAGVKIPSRWRDPFE